MNLATTALFYALIGAAVAGTILLRRDRMPPGDRWFRATTALLFWPLYLPLLLQSSSADNVDQMLIAGRSAAATAMDPQVAHAIAQVEAELETALVSLDGALGLEPIRFDELRTALRQQAARIGELDRLLARLTAASDPSGNDESAELPERIAASEAARRDNTRRLQALRDRLHEDLLATLAKVRELVSMIHLARFTGAPAARTEELVAQIADAVAGLAAVALWHEPVSENRATSAPALAARRSSPVSSPARG
jgi:hypothetical protein